MIQNNYFNGTNNEQIKGTKTAKDILEIKQLLFTYRQTGYLDRDKAIEKICGARCEEPFVQAMLMPKSPMSSVPYTKVPDSQLAEQLSFVHEYLSSKFATEAIKNSGTQG